MQVSFRKLFKYADGLDCLLMATGSLAAIAHGLVLPINMYYFGRIVNALATNQSDRDAAGSAVLKFAIAMFIVALNSGWVTWLAEVWCWLYTGERQSSRIRVRYLESLLHQEVAFFDTEANTGSIVNHIASDILLVQDAMGEKVGGFIHNMATFIGGVVVALFNGWQIALLAIATVPLLAGTGAVYTRLYTAMFTRSQASHAQASSIAEQTISQIRTVYSFVQESRALTSFSDALQAARKIGERGGLIRGMGLGLTLGIVNCSWALELWCGSILVSKGHIDGGKILTAVFCIVFGGMALGQTTPELQVFSRGRVAAYNIFNIIDRASKIDSRNIEGEVPEKLDGYIEFDEIHFHYPARPDVTIFQGLSLEVPAGSSVALVGESGSGKSTVISLLQRFYNPISGEIRLDGRNIAHLQLKWLRKNIGVVAQEPVLFATSIKENIRLGKIDATDEEIEAAATASNAIGFIMQLPERFETQVGYSTAQLSGGQKQRIALARMIVKNPTILLLDEATSALDIESEHKVKDALDAVMVNRTAITVAHRLSTIQNAKKIAVFSKGKVIELGTHEQLLQKEGAYATLVRLQERNKDNHKHCLLVVNRPETYFQPSSLSPYRPSLDRTGNSPLLSQEPKNQQSEIELRRWSSLWQLCKLAGRNWLELSTGSVAALVTGCINPLFALFLIEVVQLYYQPGSMHKVNRWCAIITALGATAICTNIFQHYLYAKAAESISQKLEEHAFTAILENEIEWFDKEENTSNALTAQLSSNASSVRTAMSDRVCLLLQYTTSICLAMALGFRIKWEMAIITIATFPFSMVGGSMKQGFLQKGFAGDLEKLHAKASNVAGEAVSNIRTLASFCAEAKILGVFQDQLSQPLKQSFIRAQKGGILFGLSQCGLHLANATGLWYVSLLVKKGRSNYADALKVFQILAWTGYVLAEALNLFPDITKALHSVACLQKITRRKTQMRPDEPHSRKSDDILGEVEFIEVDFSYPSRPLVPVLSKFNLHMRAGMTVALVGSSGSGKSSVIQLVMRFYDPTAGRVLLDGHNLRNYNLRWLRKHISLVNQEPSLFSTSIRSNITYGKDNATEEETIAAARIANAHGFISSLPQGYETSVGERGVQLSGGQKQRIAIARAVIKDPAILMLDEATSALDSESERAVQQALDEILERRNRTTLVIAHRLSTVRHAHAIAVLQQGRIVELGSHDHLMADPRGAYARMIQEG
ncbi:ATP-binding cassette transporter [Selaginella moellendorffii]|uniref:ATP-binding cassette transporter n=1 Tax=Selaginella moellendorffii TaxID=88036 RepID=D8R468_SELML|nr:ATP-binding cassette transporter [Selaginella moellendorffii]